MSVADWIAGQRPPVPEGFRPWVLDHLQEPPSGAGALALETREAMARSLAGTGARGGAFDLLVADALATWAAQALLEETDADRRLDDLVRALAG